MKKKARQDIALENQLAKVFGMDEDTVFNERACHSRNQFRAAEREIGDLRRKLFKNKKENHNLPYG